jgi:mRNA interferase MazF
MRIASGAGPRRPVATATPTISPARPAPYRIAPTFQGKWGLILLDQIRTRHKVRLVKRLGDISSSTLASTLKTLQNVLA